MRKIIEKLKKKKTVFILSASMLIFAGGVLAHVYVGNNPQHWDNGYRLWDGNRIFGIRYGNADGTDDTNFCTIARNTSPDSYFVPTRKFFEFDSFKKNPPPGADLCCESSTCINYGQNQTAVLHTQGINVIQCIQRPGCCIIPESDLGLGKEGVGFFDAVRHGASGWNTSCDVKGNINCENGPACDCECRWKLDENGVNQDLYCADNTATIPARTCRVRGGSIITLGTNTTSIAPLGDWAECKASDGKNCSPIW